MKAKIRRWMRGVCSSPYVQGIVTGIVGTIVAGMILYITLPAIFPPDGDFASMRYLIRVEAELARQKPRTTLVAEQYGSLFTDDAWIVDVGTQTFWRGIPEILERFRSLEEFKTLEHRLDEGPTFTGNGSAVASTVTHLAFVDRDSGMEKTHIGREVWLFDKTDDEWRIGSLQVNIP